MKVVVPVAGLGTRMLPSTKEQPKEMLPVFDEYRGKVFVKPLVQLIFEKLWEFGIREFCFVVGRGKRVIEDHFTPDRRYVEVLKDKGKAVEAELLEKFYEKIVSSSIVWVNQDEPQGFGDAVLRAKSFVGSEAFIVHAGDTLIVEQDGGLGYLERAVKLFNDVGADAVFVVRRVEDPRIYGVAVVEEVGKGVLRVLRVVEKPREPPSNYAIMPIYVFHPVIFKALENLKPGARGEIELTDAIQRLIDWGLKVYAVEASENTVWLDIGVPENYWRALRLSYELAVERAKGCPKN